MATGYNGSRTIYGSWLMDESALISLEDVAKDIFTYLHEIQETIIAQCEEEDKNKYRYRYLTESEINPVIEITFINGTKKSASSFREIFDLLEIRENIVKKVVITTRCLGTKVDLVVSSGETSLNYFKYEVTGTETISNYESYKNIVIGKIENWIDEHKPDLLLKIWYELAKWSTIGMLLLLLVAYLSLAAYSNSKAQYFKNFESEIAEIVETGITEENRDRAIQLLLVKQYDYVPESWTQESEEAGNKTLFYCGIGALLCLFVKFRPRTNFSIGKGKTRVKFWKKYKQIVFIGIPTGLIIPILINIFV